VKAELAELEASLSARAKQPDANLLQDLHERYRKLLENAPESMRPRIVESLEKTVRQLEEQPRQKRIKTASREPVALREERERIEQGKAPTSAAAREASEKARKRSVY
jgi:hypothetical protein